MPRARPAAARCGWAAASTATMPACATPASPCSIRARRSTPRRPTRATAARWCCGRRTTPASTARSLAHGRPQRRQRRLGRDLLHDNLQAWGSIDVRAAPAGRQLAARPVERHHRGRGQCQRQLQHEQRHVVGRACPTRPSMSPRSTASSATAPASPSRPPAPTARAGNININADIAKTGGGRRDLTMIANGTINDNGFTISSTVGKLNVNDDGRTARSRSPTARRSC